ncbi:MAG: hypothetical protein AAFN93_15405 [Bacteroidota bacterium]
MKRLHIIAFIIIATVLSSCGGKEFTKQPIDLIIKDMPTDRVFSIILHDMDAEGSFFKTYRHQYKVIQEKEKGKPEEEITGWYEVSKETFQRYGDDMGMEVASRGEDGKLIKSVSPPGYNNYVGNPRYGQWENRGGTSFWAFYGQYAFMSSMFNMLSYPVRRSYYDDYRSNYYGRGRSYYGPTVGGSPYYGTYSKYNTSSRPNSRWSQNTNSFRNRVNSRTSRSGSRYSSSSSRSRGGGFGK